MTLWALDARAHEAALPALREAPRVPCRAHMLYEARWLVSTSRVLAGMLGPIMLVEELISTSYLKGKGFGMSLSCCVVQLLPKAKS